MHVVVAQYVADILAQITFDALAKFLHSLDVLLRYAPGTIRRIGRPRLEFRNALFHAVIPRQIGNQILQVWEGLHRFDGHGLFQRE